MAPEPGQPGNVTPSIPMEPISSNGVENRLMQVTSRHYTLQLMGSHSLRAVKDFMRRNNLQGKAKYYSAVFRGSKWYMLIYGEYPSVVRARAAIRQLPGSVRAMHPWVKPYSIVKREIRSREIVS